MPPKNRVRGVRTTPSNIVDESIPDLLQSGNIESLHTLVRRFEHELSELKQKNMDRNNSSTIDAAARRVRMIALLEEFSALANSEEVLSPKLREATSALHEVVIRSLTRGSELSHKKIPTTAPELYKNRKDKTETAIPFTLRVYGEYNGTITARDIRRLDYSLYNSIYTAKSDGQKFPDWFSLPNQTQVRDKELDDTGVTAILGKDDPRVTLRTLRAFQRRLSSVRKNDR